MTLVGGAGARNARRPSPEYNYAKSFLPYSRPACTLRGAAATGAVRDPRCPARHRRARDCEGQHGRQPALAPGRGPAGRLFFCVEVRDDLFALDLDDPAQEPTLDQLVAELRSAGAVPVLVASGRREHRHLFVRVRDRDRWIARAKEAGFRGDTV